MPDRKASPPTHYALADIGRRHHQHTCTGHQEPGICVHDRERWPCDVRMLLDLVAVQEFAGTLVREARAVGDEWTAYVGDWDADGHDDTEKMGQVIARLRGVLAAIDGTVRDPLEFGRA